MPTSVYNRLCFTLVSCLFIFLYDVLRDYGDILLSSCRYVMVEYNVERTNLAKALKITPGKVKNLSI